jgi:hypothetical protein
MAEDLGSAVLDLATDDTLLGHGLNAAHAGAEALDRKFDKVTRDISQRFDRIGKKFQEVGKILSVSLTAPIAGVAAFFLKNADEMLQGQTRLSAAIRAAGGDVERELPVFNEYAAAIQRITTVGDDATIANIQVARSMGLSAQQSAQAAKNAVALSAAFGINERSAIRYTAALEQGDTTMLNRYIPTLRLIEDDSERVAEAQRILADAFDVATASAAEGFGPLKQFSNALGDLGEGFGAIIFDAINPFILRAKAFVEALQGMSDETRTNILVIGGIAAAIGPAVLALGLLIRALGFAIGGFRAFAAGMRLLVVGSLLAWIAPLGAFAIALTAVGAAMRALDPEGFRQIWADVSEGVASAKESLLSLVEGAGLTPGPIRETEAQLAGLAEQLSNTSTGFDTLGASSEAAAERLVNSTRTTAEAMRADFEQINQLLDQGQITIDQWMRAQEQTAERYGNTWGQVAQQIAGSVAFIGQSFAKESSTMATIAKIAGVVQATISMFVGAAKALELPWPANLAAMAAVLAQGASIVAQIKSTAVPAFAEGGRFRVGGTGITDNQLMMFRAKPGEMVDIRHGDQAGSGEQVVIRLPDIRPEARYSGREVSRLFKELSNEARLRGLRLAVERGR